VWEGGCGGGWMLAGMLSGERGTWSLSVVWGRSLSLLYFSREQFYRGVTSSVRRVDSVSWTKTDDSCLTISKLLPQALPSSSTTMACIMTPTVSTMASTMRGRAVASRSPASTSSRSTSTITARVTRKTAAPAPKGVRVGKDFNLPNPAKLFMPKSDAKALPTKAKAGTSNKTAARKVTAAQQFSVKIPGKVFQSNNDVVKTVELGFTKANELFVGRCVSPPIPATAATSIAMSISGIRAAHPSNPPPPLHMPSTSPSLKRTSCCGSQDTVTSHMHR
jgi:hypothetical protein